MRVSSIDSSLIWAYRLFREYAFGGHCHSTFLSARRNSFNKLVDGHLIPQKFLGGMSLMYDDQAIS